MMRLTGSVIPSQLKHLDGAYRTNLPSMRDFKFWRGRPVRRLRRWYVVRVCCPGQEAGAWKVIRLKARTRTPLLFKAGGAGGKAQK